MFYPVESKRFPGFYVPFGNKDVVISKDGRVISLHTGKFLSVIIRNHGYRSVNYSRTVDKTQIFRQYLIHRMLALAFIEIPEDLTHLPLSKIQVNHRDGDKLNNRLDNLEWVRAKRNMRHAFTNRLIDIGITTLAKDVRTGETKKFGSVAECAEAFNIQTKKLRRHLNSLQAGLISKEWHVFKKDDSTPWPNLHANDRVMSKWEYTSAVIAEKDSQKLIFNSIREACKALKLDYKSVKNSRSRSIRKGTAFKSHGGWMFHELDSVAGIDLKGLPPATRKRRYVDKRFSVTNTLTDESREIVGIKELSKFIDYSLSHVEGLLRKGVTVIGDYKIDQYQGQRGLQLAKV